MVFLASAGASGLAAALSPVDSVYSIPLFFFAHPDIDNTSYRPERVPVEAAVAPLFDSANRDRRDTDSFDSSSRYSP